MHRLRRLVLRLAGCSFRTSIVQLLEGHGEDLQRLTLDIRSNRLNTTGAIAINDALLSFRQLRSLRFRVSFNPIGNAGIPNLSALTHLRRLTLSLDNCNICDMGVAEGLSFLERLRELTRLNLQLAGNNLTTVSAAPLLHLTRSLTDLSLYLPCNRLQHEGVETLSRGFSASTKLSRLFLDVRDNDCLLPCHALRELLAAHDAHPLWHVVY